MDEGKARNEGNRFFSLRNSIPRGDRFSRLSEAYLKITSRQRSHNSVHKDSGEHPSPEAISCPAIPPAPPVAYPRLAKSQDELRLPNTDSAEPSFMEKIRRLSVDSIERLRRLSSDMGSNSSSRLSLDEQIDHQLLKLKSQSQSTTNSTIEGILAQYDAPTSNLEVECDNKKENRVNPNLSISQPPQGALPEMPPMAIQRSSRLCQDEYDSSAPDSSITDSQHLLDAEAQAQEMEEARRALVPLPLNTARPLHSIGSPQEHQATAHENTSAFNVDKNIVPANTTLTHPVVQGYETYLYPPMQRDISQRLRHQSLDAEHTAGSFCSSGAEDDLFLQFPTPPGMNFSLSRANTTAKLSRETKVMIGQEPHTSKVDENNDKSRVEVERERHDIFSDDGDWVTEATSDAGLDFCRNVPSGRPLTGGFKVAGSSLADFSDDDNEGVMDRFGSQERIIQCPESNEQYGILGAQRSNESKVTALVPHKYRLFPNIANQHWENTTEKVSTQFRPQTLRKVTDPCWGYESRRQEITRRLVFDFDHNAPPKYEFRDSVSEYEPATASTEANCGTNQYDTRGSLPSLESDSGEDSPSPAARVCLYQSVGFDADRKSCSSSLENHQTYCRGQGMIYGVSDQGEPKERQKREFVVASSYYDRESPVSVRSKFNHGLLPLDVAQRMNKIQRESGEIDETESSGERLQRKQHVLLIKAAAGQIERPKPAILTSRDLSSIFSPPSPQPDRPVVQGPDIPFPIVTRHPQETLSNLSPNRRNDIWLGAPESPSTLDSVLTSTFSGWSHEKLQTTMDKYTRRMKKGPDPIRPGHYISERAMKARQICFYLLAVLSLLPFIGVLALTGAFSDTFKWATRGELDRLTAGQRRFIKWMLLIEFILYTGGLVAIIVYFVVRSKIPN
ncbi:hypothetical protein F4802DRAFT_592758 [Xylaria palmicola]|nr:hypothetical protein F4802DRAFT_592758 [Xylaria palmicola]